jgi:hypothetical protein
MLTQIIRRLCITLVKELANKPGPEMVALGGALEYMGLTPIDVLNRQCEFEECKNWCVPFF